MLPSNNSTPSTSIEIVDPEASCIKANHQKIYWTFDGRLFTKIQKSRTYSKDRLVNYQTFDLKYGFEYTRTPSGCLLKRLDKKFKIWRGLQ